MINERLKWKNKNTGYFLVFPIKIGLGIWNLHRVCILLLCHEFIKMFTNYYFTVILLYNVMYNI